MTVKSPIRATAIILLRSGPWLSPQGLCQERSRAPKLDMRATVPKTISVFCGS